VDAPPEQCFGSDVLHQLSCTVFPIETLGMALLQLRRPRKYYVLRHALQKLACLGGNGTDSTHEMIERQREAFGLFDSEMSRIGILEAGRTMSPRPFKVLLLMIVKPWKWQERSTR
jgi:hypothetical protein